MLAMLALVANASASVIWDLTPFETDDGSRVRVTVFDPSGSSIEIKMELIAPVGAGGTVQGDLRGLWFNVEGGITGFSSSMFSSTPNGAIDQVCLSPTGSLTCGPGNNLNGPDPGFPANAFQVGLELGQPGASGGLLTNVSIFINFSSIVDRTFTANTFKPFAARVTSVGPNGGSDKLYSGPTPREDQETVVPEPSTWLMLGAGLALVTLAKLRRTRQN